MKKLLLFLLLSVAPAAAQQVTTLPAQDEVLPGKPVPQFAIGAEDGEDWELLSRVAQVVFDREENLYVLDAGNHRILVFNPQGKFVRRIGKQGGGPGELMTPVGLAITSAGEVAVTDLGRPAVSLFKKDGTFIRNITFGEEFGMPLPVQSTNAHPGGGVAVRTMPVMMRRGAPGDIAPGRMTNRKSPITWFTADNKQTKLYEFALPDITPKVSENDAGGGRAVMVRVQSEAFAAPTVWGMLPNGLVAASSDVDYKIQLARNGKVERVIQRPIKARHVTEADKVKEKARRREVMARGAPTMVFSSAERRGSGPEQRSTRVGAPMDKAEIERMLNELTFAEYMPVLAGMYVDPRGRIWVQRAGREVGQDGPIDLIDGSGRYLGTVNGQKLPAAVSLTGRAAYVERDDMDVEKVVVRKLPAGW
jgi:hypothetical protein